MSRAVLVAFHPYVVNRNNDDYWLWWEAWQRNFDKWGHLFDKAYLIDQDWGFSEEMLSPKFEIWNTKDMKGPIAHHWDSFAQVIPHITEDSILMMDNDMLIYDAEWMTEWIKEVETFDLSCIFDNSGSIPNEELFPDLRPNINRDYRRRIAPYLCFVSRDLLMQTSLDFAPRHTGQPLFQDSFGYWTTEIMGLSPSVLEIPDVRKFVFWPSVDEPWSSIMWLDDVKYAWSNPSRLGMQEGYYHVRNWSLGLSIVNTFHENRRAYERHKEIVPFAEAVRQLAWVHLIDPTGDISDRVLPVVEDFGISVSLWKRYLFATIDLHPWLAP